MSNRTRTISWCEGRILEVLAKNKCITSYLALSACTLRSVRSLEEQHNLDIALAKLLSQHKIIQNRIESGGTVYRLAG